MRKLNISKNLWVLIDNEDYSYLSRFNWGVDSNSIVERQIRNGKTRNRIPMWCLLVLNKNGGRVVHINGNMFDFRKSNLRVVPEKVLSHNAKKRTNTSSRYKGVCWDKVNQKWRAYIVYDGKRYDLGRFDNEIIAAFAYNEKAIELYGLEAFQNKIKLNVDVI